MVARGIEVKELDVSPPTNTKASPTKKDDQEDKKKEKKGFFSLFSRKS
jgi:hypothetical protein